MPQPEEQGMPSPGPAGWGQQVPPDQAMPPYGAPPAVPPGHPPPYMGPPLKDKMIAGILGILPPLGGLGIHRFYLGYIGIGIAQIFVTIFTFGIGAWWGIIEGIMILATDSWTDAEGRPLKGNEPKPPFGYYPPPGGYPPPPGSYPPPPGSYPPPPGSYPPPPGAPPPG